MVQVNSGERVISGAAARRPDYQALMAAAWKDEAQDSSAGSTESS
jgi:hypothetical protein